ncbi:hypothetical protein EJ08DRAFT_694337 [Tothia fuscella]|uniref:F-box domain-containing protein n=1 Tax=Tothia fuscella TaxID=1048955 RepID=A0A9P4NZ94_9PEZI|nr:hypothetical protein EJ08DRAFT_694337 [Tothia fuscella]
MYNHTMTDYSPATIVPPKSLSVSKLEPGMVIQKDWRRLVIMGICTLNESARSSTQSKRCGIVIFNIAEESIWTTEWRCNEIIEVLDVKCPIAHEYRLINLNSEGQMSLAPSTGPFDGFRNDLLAPRSRIGELIKDHWENRRDVTYQHINFPTPRSVGLSMMPAELLLDITQYLSLSDFVRLRSTCKKMTVQVERPISITTLECSGRVRIIKVMFAGGAHQNQDTMTGVDQCPVPKHLHQS